MSRINFNPQTFSARLEEMDEALSQRNKWINTSLQVVNKNNGFVRFLKVMVLPLARMFNGDTFGSIRANKVAIALLAQYQLHKDNLSPQDAKRVESILKKLKQKSGKKYQESLAVYVAMVPTKTEKTPPAPPFATRAGGTFTPPRLKPTPAKGSISTHTPKQQDITQTLRAAFAKRFQSATPPDTANDGDEEDNGDWDDEKTPTPPPPPPPPSHFGSQADPLGALRRRLANRKEQGGANPPPVTQTSVDEADVAKEASKKGQRGLRPTQRTAKKKTEPSELEQVFARRNGQK